MVSLCEMRTVRWDGETNGSILERESVVENVGEAFLW